MMKWTLAFFLGMVTGIVGSTLGLLFLRLILDNQ